MRVALVALLFTAAASAPEKPMSFFELHTKTLEGAPRALSDYQGKVVLVVNVASQCGFTPQYAGLEKLWEEYQGKGLVILGFPSNEFGQQEPGTPEEIRQFCDLKYHVKFPIMEKVKTQGEGQSPVYAFLSSGRGVPKWNFHKYLVGKDGQVKGEFKSAVTPESDELHKAIDAALASK